MSNKRDYYEILGLTQSASVEEIEKAYRKLARQYHPDRNIGDETAAHKFREATEAHDILVDSEKRAIYDRYGHAGLEGMAGGGGFPGGSASDFFTDILSSFFGGGGTGRRSRGPQSGNDIQIELEIDLVEAYTGCKKSIPVQRLEHCKKCNGKGTLSGKKTSCKRCAGKGVIVNQAGFFAVQRECPSCRGSGQEISDPCNNCRGQGKVNSGSKIEVNIPPGVDTGVHVQLRGEGEAGDPGAPRGNLDLIIRVADHPDFSRQRDELYCGIPITFSQAALGATIEIPTLTGKTSLQIPRGTHSHSEILISGEGMPNLRSPNRRGNLHVVVVIETPQSLTKRQEELLRELSEIDQKVVSAPKKGLLDRLKHLFQHNEDS